MHIPPGFLEPGVWVPMTGAATVGVGYALKKTGETTDDRRVPVMGVLAAFIFAAQMVNFPVLGGTSGHLMGAALAVTVFGVWPAVMIMAAVVIMQALLFQDGGLDALGANIMNMAVLGSIVSGPLIGFGRRFGRRGLYAGAALAGWISVLLASALCAVELALSGTAPIGVVLPAMLVVHAVIGIFEGLITVIAIRFILTVSPHIIQNGGGASR